MLTRLCGAATLAAAVVVCATPPMNATRGNFIPDWSFKSSTLSGWRTLGDADWKAVDGELTGTPKTPGGGWLVLDKALPDVQVGFDVRCSAGCKTGVLLRAEKTAEGGMKGIFASLTADEGRGFAKFPDATAHAVLLLVLRRGG